MKKNVMLLLFVAMAALSASGQTLTFQMGGNDDAEILNQGAFNELGSFIGNTNGNTQIRVGEVDFGSGNVYQAVSVRYANGWDQGGRAILSAGDNLASATPFASIDLINWGSYTNFRSIGANFTAAPTGVKQVFLTFEGRAGNVMDVRFYNDAFTADMFESGSMLKEPCNIDGYANLATVLSVQNSVLIHSNSSDTRVDDNTNSWGWTGDGVIVKYGDVNFGSGDYNQVVVGVNSHWQGDQKDHSVDVYIDDFNNEANRIANVWCGIEIPGGKMNYLARNIEAISGVHTVYLKWHGASINVADVHFVKGHLFSLGNIYYPIVSGEDVNIEPSDNAVTYSFRSSAQGSSNYVGRESGRTRIIYQGQWEDNNVGWTKNRSILRITNVNFKSNEFNKMFATYAAAGGQNPNCSLQFFIDTTINNISLRNVLNDAGIQLSGLAQILFNAVTAGTTVDALLNDYDINQIIGMVGEGNGDALVNALFNHIQNLTPVASVPLVSTGDWGRETRQVGDLSAVSGTHNVYIVFNANGDNGANVKEFCLSTYTPPVDNTITATLAQIKQNGDGAQDYIIPDGTLTCVTTYTDGDYTMLVCRDDNGAAQQLPASGEVDFLSYNYDEVPAQAYNHSNWIVLRTSEPMARVLKGATIRNIKGALTRGTDELTLSSLPLSGTMGEFYTPNTYVPCSFYGTQTSEVSNFTYFFVEPQPGEYAIVRWAEWDGTRFTVPNNGPNLQGSFDADLSQATGATPVEGNVYELTGIVTTAGSQSSALRAPGSGNLALKVATITDDNQIVTGVTDINAAPERGDQPIYDLTGRRVVNPAPGIYIVGNKKVLIK